MPQKKQPHQKQQIQKRQWKSFRLFLSMGEKSVTVSGNPVCFACLLQFVYLLYFV
jgi:hypothetical protein